MHEIENLILHTDLRRQAGGYEADDFNEIKIGRIQMKHIYLLFTFVLMPVFSFAELQIKIGNDTTFCGSSFEDSEVPQLGTNLTITDGVPPYKYVWSAEINTYDNTYDADYFLDNKTISTPTFKSHWHNQNWESFTLTVTDAENNIATDVIKVRFSLYYYTLVWCEHYKNIGDEITLMNININGGIKPYRSYEWSPNDGLLTPNEETTVCKVTRETVYSLTVEDSVGCKTTNDVCKVNILSSSGTIETEYTDNNIPFIKEGVLFWENADKLPVIINLYSLNGAKIKEVYPVTNEYSLKNNVSVPILYEIVIGNRRYVDKYMFN